MDAINAKTKKSSKATKPSGRNPTNKKSTKGSDPLISDNNKENDDSGKSKKSKKKSKPKDDGKTKHIDEYFKKVKGLPTITTPQPQPKSKPPNSQHQSPQIKTCSTPLSLTELSFDFDNSSDDILDLSDIIRRIVSDSPTVTNLCGKKLHYECVKEQSMHEKSIVDVGDKDETADEFDMIVAGMKPIPSDKSNQKPVTTTPITSRKKASKKRPVDKTSSKKCVNDGSPTATPVLIKKFFKRNRIVQKPSSTPSMSPIELRNETSNDNANVSFFFGDITEENDAFEKLIDFRNMEDEVCTNNDLDDGDKLQVIDDSPELQLSETFDLEDYVPVGANLKKRLAA